eukprot:TRINITY_DN5231_c0_g1_i3.p1 TRINITY_DN5231_c0_g1~~TRINITY_DN5231_c0_g1_i3.p1  ORF type:complete len:245 (-),score=13.32 TRINITY_DN5231_c0_g1_i3:381-1115(-)
MLSRTSSIKQVSNGLKSLIRDPLSWGQHRYRHDNAAARDLLSRTLREMKSGKPQQQQPPPPPPRQQGTSAARPQFVHRDPSDDLPEGVAPSLVRLHARLQGAERQAVRARTPNLKALFQRRRLSPELDSMWKAQQRVPKESRVVWDPESDDPVVAALQEHARYQPWEVPNSDPVRNTNAMLRSLGYNPSPDDAFRILVALGHFPGKKVNPQLFRAPVKSLTKDEGARITEVRHPRPSMYRCLCV